MNVSFSAVSLNEVEGGVVRFTLDKTQGAVGDVSVRLFTIDDSAIGEHYITIPYYSLQVVETDYQASVYFISLIIICYISVLIKFTDTSVMHSRLTHSW